jgi:hypothetical protein
MKINYETQSLKNLILKDTIKIKKSIKKNTKNNLNHHMMTC